MRRRGELLRLRLDQVSPNPWNCNILTQDERLKLKRQMSISGPDRTPPIIVRKVNDTYQIVDGEQRWRVATDLGWKHIYSVPVEADEMAAKALCLSYNILRGRVDWYKLRRVLDQDMKGGVDIYKVYEPILTGEEIRKVLKLGDTAPEAEKYLEEKLLEGAELTLEHLSLISELPKKLQLGAAEQTVRHEYGVSTLKTLLEQLKPPVPRQPTAPSSQARKLEPSSTEGLREREKPEVEEEAFEADSEKPKPEPRQGKVLKADEAEAVFSCDCGRAYRIDYDAKRILRVKEVKGLTVFTEEPTYPAALKMKCPKCGLSGEVDVEAGEVKWGLNG
jgi:ParB-like chromosome segregation protein Spo0J